MEKVPTLPKDASLASRRAKSVVTKDDNGEYEKVNTDVVKMAAVHSLMKVGCLVFSFFLIVSSSYSTEINRLCFCVGLN